jgi:hypothetical protein
LITEGTATDSDHTSTTYGRSHGWSTESEAVYACLLPLFLIEALVLIEALLLIEAG